MTPIRIAAASTLAAALSLHSLLARSEMYVCGRADGSSVLRNMACAPQERTVSINGLAPHLWKKSNSDQLAWTSETG